MTRPRVAVEIADAKRLIGNAQTASDEVYARLEKVIELLRHAARLYASVGDDAKALLNAAVFDGFWLDSHPDEPTRGAFVADAPLTPVVGAVAGHSGHDDLRAAHPTPGTGHKKTLGERSLAEGSNLCHLAVTLTQRWENSAWERVGRLLAQPFPADAVVQPRSPRSRRPQRQTRLNLGQIEALVADYQAGMTMSEVAVKYAVSLSTASRHIKASGVEIRPRASIADSDLSTIHELYAAGATLQEIGIRYGCSRTVVARALQRHGTALRPQPAAMTEEQIDAAVELYENGLSLAQVADALDVSTKTVHTRLLKRGVVMRDQQGRARRR